MNAFHFNWCPRIFSKRKSFLFAATAAVATLLGISAAKSNAAFVLMNNNSTISLSPSDPTGPGAWTVDGVNQLGEEWLWFRIGNSAGQTNLASLPETSSMLLDTTGGTENNFARFTYGSPTALQVVLTYILAGGQTGSGASDLSESLDISNDGTTTQTYHFFEYTNFNLGDSTTGQSVTITGGNTATVDGNGKGSTDGRQPRAVGVRSFLDQRRAGSTEPDFKHDLVCHAGRCRLGAVRRYGMGL